MTAPRDTEIERLRVELAEARDAFSFAWTEGLSLAENIQRTFANMGEIALARVSAEADATHLRRVIEGAPHGPRVVTLADLRPDEPDGGAEMAVAEEGLYDTDGNQVDCRGAVLYVVRPSRPGQVKVRIWTDHGANFIRSDCRVRRLGISREEFESDACRERALSESRANAPNQGGAQ